MTVEIHLHENHFISQYITVSNHLICKIHVQKCHFLHLNVLYDTANTKSTFQISYLQKMWLHKEPCSVLVSWTCSCAVTDAIGYCRAHALLLRAVFSASHAPSLALWFKLFFLGLFSLLHKDWFISSSLAMVSDFLYFTLKTITCSTYFNMQCSWAFCPWSVFMCRLCFSQ